MKVKGRWKRITNVKITAFDLDGNIKDITEIKNILTTNGMGMVIDAWQDSTHDIEIKDLATGTGIGVPAIGDTQLGAEDYRQTITSFTEITATSLLTVTLIAAVDCVQQIKEIGWFAGAGADGVGPNIGVLVSRVLYDRLKTNLESLQIERIDTLVEG